MDVKPGLHIVVTIAEHAPDVAPKLRLSMHRLQIFLVKYEYLRSLQLRGDQGIREKLKKRACDAYDLYGVTSLQRWVAKNHVTVKPL